MTNIDDVVNDALHEIHKNPEKYKHPRGYSYQFLPSQLEHVALCEPRFGCFLQFDRTGLFVILTVEQHALDDWREEEGIKVDDED